MGAGWPFVGRESEMSTIVAALRRPKRAGNGRAEEAYAGVVLAGPAGTGKSELMRHALNRLARGDRSVKVLRTVAYASSGDKIPFHALQRVLPPRAEPFSAWNPVQEAAESLRAAAGGRALVVGVDDAHLLDDLSVLLLADLARSGGARVAVTVRDGEPAPATLTALWKERVLRRVDLLPLSDAEVESALSAALDGQVERSTLARLQAAARGNPLLLRELVESGREVGALAAVEGVWLWRGPWTASPRLRELIRARIERLDCDQRHAVELLAFAGSLGLNMLTGLTSPAAVEALERTGLIRVDRDGDRLQTGLGHPLHGDLVRATLPMTLARTRQAELADVIARKGARRRGDTLRIALWRLESGTPATPESLVAAARQAWAGSDLALTRRLLSAAVAAGSHEAVPLLGDLLVFSGEPERAEEFYADPPAWASAEVRVRLDFVRSINLLWGFGRVEEGLRLMKRAAPAMLASSWRDDLGPVYAGWLAYCGELTAALDVARDLADMPVLSEPGETVRLLTHALVAAFTGRTGEACATGRRAMARMDAHSAVVPWLRGTPVLGPIFALQFAGAFQEAETTARDWHDTMIANPTAWTYATGVSALALGRSARLTGRAAASVRHLRDARRLFREADALSLAHIGAAELAHSLVLLGRLDDARRLLAEARTSEGFTLFAFAMDAAAAAIAAAEHDIPEAVAICSRAAERARFMGAPAWELSFLHDTVRLGEPASALPRLTALSGGAVDGPLPALYLRHATALAAGDGPGLEGVAAEFAALGAMLAAAEAVSQASAAHLAMGKKGSARRCAWRAAEWAALCEGARTPALDTGHATALTRREYQIALRAARGETNAQIAAALGIASRTVGNHLYRSYEKLGVNNRTELSDLFTGPGRIPAS
ncbi:helix-turn-helix transcriptional regulator [Spongiactinospora gelatinilytica]|nr:LuxR family transcriptional regulator [Spongiactinospora gelatinilytica]